jgi:hypothetical protein
VHGDLVASQREDRSRDASGVFGAEIEDERADGLWVGRDVRRGEGPLSRYGPVGVRVPEAALIGGPRPRPGAEGVDGDPVVIELAGGAARVSPTTPAFAAQYSVCLMISPMNALDVQFTMRRISDLSYGAGRIS